MKTAIEMVKKDSIERTVETLFENTMEILRAVVAVWSHVLQTLYHER